MSLKMLYYLRVHTGANAQSEYKNDEQKSQQEGEPVGQEPSVIGHGLDTTFADKLML